MKGALPVAVDLRTTRLIRVCQGVEQASLMQTEEGRLLVRKAKAVRLFVESGDQPLAEAALDSIVTLCGEAEASDSVLRSLRTHVQHTRKAIKFAFDGGVNHA